MVPVFILLTVFVGGLILLMWGGIKLDKYLKSKNAPDPEAKDLQLKKSILEFIRPKKGPVSKITLMEKFNIQPQNLLQLISDFLDKDLIRVDEENVSLSEFGKHYYDKFLKK